jgi:putative transposase
LAGLPTAVIMSHPIENRYETAKRVLQKAPVVFVEDLAVKNLSARCKPKQDENGNYIANGQARKSGLNKSIADAGWAQFIDILSFKAESAGGKVVKVNPKNTSQVCSNCLNVVPKTLKERWHDCNQCNLSIDRDINSAILIKKLGLDVSLSIKRSRIKPREAHAVA